MRTIWFIFNLFLSIFICSIPIILIGYFDRRKKYTAKLSKLWSKWVLSSSGLKYKLYGLDNLDINRQYIFISNHVSALDIILGFSVIPSNIAFLAKKELFRVPFFGWAMSAAGMISIDRKNPEKARKSIDKAGISLLDSNFSTIIYPEGTRSDSRVLLPFKKGGFILAIRTKLPIVPFTIIGAGEALPKGTLNIKKKEIILVIDKPIETKNMKLEDKDQLLESCRTSIMNNLNNVEYTKDTVYELRST